MSLVKRKSPINGIGIFTTENIPKGKAFYIVPLDVIYNHPVPGCARIADNQFVCDEKVLNYTNHSCNPNSSLSLNPPSLIALKDIKKNEEITADYENTELKVKKVKCNCRSENCRGYFYIE